MASEPEHKIIEHRITAPTTNVLAIISLILALLGILTSFLIPFISQLVAIICGHIARSQIKNSSGSQTGSGIALAGLIISYFSLVISLIGFILLGAGIMALIS